MSNFAPYNDDNFNFKKGVYENFAETPITGPSENPETQLQELCSKLGWMTDPNCASCHAESGQGLK